MLVSEAARGENEPVVGVTASIAASADGSGVVTQEIVLDQLRRAEGLYAPFGVHFRLVENRTLPNSKADLVTPKDRDALASFCERGVINVMFVASLRDIDVTEEVYRMGVTWTGPGARYVIVASAARETTLAHELGHFFGLQHVKTKNNLMSYDRDGGPVFLDADQKRAVLGNARALVQTRSLTLESWASPNAGALEI